MSREKEGKMNMTVRVSRKNMLNLTVTHLVTDLCQIIDKKRGRFCMLQED